MADNLRVSFDDLAVPATGTLVLLADSRLALGKVTRKFERLVAKAAKVAGFKGKLATTLDILAPAGVGLDRLLVVGVGKAADLEPTDWQRLGGAIAGKARGDSRTLMVAAETSAGAASPEQAADLALGLQLGAYEYRRYKSKKDEDEGRRPGKIIVGAAHVAAARQAFHSRQAVADGVIQARDLVNAPPNDLGPQEFAQICSELAELGVIVEVFREAEMAELGMRALLGVGQGSARGSRLVVMRWEGGGKARPIAFVGKGVVFDTGGISIKPAQNMEDMKGDMAGAAAVAGVMRTLAARKAKANVVGIIGLVENMPDGAAQRPGDIVRSMSGQTIEIINTDAEGRLVLADALWYCQDRFKPQFMIDLATLTGAIMVALGHEYAGLFSNDDALAEKLLAAGKATGEKVWRMPLAPEYDKIMDSKFADVKNSGGRNAGAIIAAQFLKRFVNDCPWAHLDIAGTGFGGNATDINRSWAPGFGVRLLDRLVADNYET
jgi:leucyl aminopeptidase